MAKTDGSDVTAVAKQEEKKPPTLVDYINGMKPEIQRALPAHLDADRIARIAITTLRTNKALQQCDPMSFVAALMQAAQLGLEPNTPLGHAYIIPYKGQATFQLGYQGILDLAYRTGEYQTIYAQKVYSNDAFDYEYGLDPYLKHKPASKPEGEPVFYYAVYKLKNGGTNFAVMSREQIDKHAQRFSQSFKSGGGTPWQTDYDSMALKTVLKVAMKYAPKSAEFSKQLATDETVKRELNEDMTLVQPDTEVYEDGEVVEETISVPQEQEAEPEQPPVPTGEELRGLRDTCKNLKTSVVQACGKKAGEVTKMVGKYVKDQFGKAKDSELTAEEWGKLFTWLGEMAQAAEKKAADEIKETFGEEVKEEPEQGELTDG